MKKINYFFFLILGVMICSFSACENDELDPDFDKRDDIDIKWTCEAYEQTENGSEFAGNYDVLIKKSETSENEIIMTNFHNWGDDKEVVATLTGNILTLNSQTILGYNLSGEGNIAEDLQSITWTYTLDDGVEVLNYTSKFSPGSVAKRKSL